MEPEGSLPHSQAPATCPYPILRNIHRVSLENKTKYFHTENTCNTAVYIRFSCLRNVRLIGEEHSSTSHSFAKSSSLAVTLRTVAQGERSIGLRNQVVCEIEQENFVAIKIFTQKYKVLPNTAWETILIGKCEPRWVNRFEVRGQNFKNKLKRYIIRIHYFYFI